MTFSDALMLIVHYADHLKVEYHTNEKPLNNSEKIAYVGQRLMHAIIIKNNTLPR